jgi:hypothetical protein
MDDDLDDLGLLGPLDGGGVADLFNIFDGGMQAGGEDAAAALLPTVAVAADTQLDEASYVSPFEWFASQYMFHLPLWHLVEGREQKQLGMGNTATPTAILEVFHRTIKERASSQRISAEVKTTEFSEDAWVALYRECGGGSGIPRMANQDDRFAVLAYLRHHFSVNDGKVEEFVYDEDGTSMFAQRHNKSQLKNLSDAQVSSALPSRCVVPFNALVICRWSMRTERQSLHWYGTQLAHTRGEVGIRTGGRCIRGSVMELCR